MLFAAIALSFASLAAAAPSLKRSPALIVSLSTDSSAIQSVGALTIVASVENTSNDDIKVLKYNTVLDTTATRSFQVQKDGADVAFQGIAVQLALNDLDVSDFIVIPAGQKVTAVHTNLAPLYDFSSAGAGTFDFTPLANFQVVGADAIVNDLTTDTLRVSSINKGGVSVEITEDVEKRDMKELEKRATVSCSNTSQRSFISSSYSEGKSLASIASSYVSSRGASDSLYRAYFGTTPTSTVTRVLNNVANENSSSRTLNCSDPYGVCTGGVIAYTVTSTTNIYYCSIFYNEVATSSLCSGTTVASRNVRGGTTLHELTHATSGTTDVGYGCSYDQSLGSSNPAQAARNADNYNCFATQVYQNTRC